MQFLQNNGIEFCCALAIYCVLVHHAINSTCYVPVQQDIWIEFWYALVIYRVFVHHVIKWACYVSIQQDI